MVKKEYFFSLIDLFLPRICPGCGEHLSRGEEELCVKCLATLPETGFYNKQENPVFRKYTGRFDFKQAAACYYFQKSSVVQHIIHHFKYKDGKDTALFMGKQMGRLLEGSDTFDLPDVIVPVPLHARKKKQRGYNQSALLAKGIAERLNIPVGTNLLIRRAQTQTQTKLNAVQRWENVKTAFTLSGDIQEEHKHFLLVDDVVTSGATLEACARTLSQLKDVRISMLALAVADH